MKLIISTTAHQIGFGTDVYKHVVGLTDAEKTAVKNGELVIFKSRLSGGNHGTPWRKVIYRSKISNGFLPRVPTVEELKLINI